MSVQTRPEAFLKRRRRLVRAWPFVGGGLLAALVLFSAWLYVRTPLLINPVEIVRRIEGGGVDSATLLTLAGLVPVLLLSCIFLLFVLIAFGFAKFRTESKYLALLAEHRSVES